MSYPLKRNARQTCFAHVWNMRYPVGTEVLVRLRTGQQKSGKTANVANALVGIPGRSGLAARAAVLVEGEGLSGHGEGIDGRIYRLSRVYPKAA